MIYRSLAQLASYTRQLGDLEGQTALERHPDASVYAAVNRGVDSFRRLLVQVGGAAEFLASEQVAVVAGQSLYPMPLDLYSLWAVDLGPNFEGQRDWLFSLDPIEATHADGEAPRYRVIGSNIEIVPAPKDGQSLMLWYVASPVALSNPSEMVEVFEEYVSRFAVRELTTKDRAWDVVDRMTQQLQELVPQIRVFARLRDQGSPPRIRDTWNERTSRHRRTIP